MISLIMWHNGLYIVAQVREWFPAMQAQNLTQIKLSISIIERNNF